MEKELIIVFSKISQNFIYIKERLKIILPEFMEYIIIMKSKSLMKEIGLIIEKKEQESKNIKMEVDMKENIKMELNMVSVFIIGKMVLYMKVNGNII